MMISEVLAINHSTPIGNLFTEEYRVHTFESNTLMKEVFTHFTTFAADVVIIVDEAISIGIITLKDLIRILHNCDNLIRPVKEFMTTPLHTFHASMSIAEVLDEMKNALFDKIVVTYDTGVIDVIDRRHLLSFCYNQLTPMIKHEYNMLHSLIRLVGEGEHGLLKMATTDVLTGIGNRRLLEEVFHAHQRLEERYAVDIFLLMFDIDGFKDINDTFGHNVGDLVLKELTKLVSNSIRKSDIFIRWGGEEFMILLRYSDSETVVKIAEQIRTRIDNYHFETIIHMTCSFGLTSIKANESLENVIERADKALYRAKADGKNTVRIEEV